MRKCHKCRHDAEVKAGLYKDVAFEETPCGKCVLRESSLHTRMYVEESADGVDPVCEVGDTCHGEEEVEAMLPVSALTAVVALLLALPPKTRDLVCWRHQGMRYKEIARKMGGSTGAMEMRHKRALEKWPELRALFVEKVAKQARHGAVG